MRGADVQPPGMLSHAQRPSDLSVAGSLPEAWASQKSVRRKGRGEEGHGWPIGRRIMELAIAELDR